MRTLRSLVFTFLLLTAFAVQGGTLVSLQPNPDILFNYFTVSYNATSHVLDAHGDADGITIYNPVTDKVDFVSFTGGRRFQLTAHIDNTGALMGPSAAALVVFGSVDLPSAEDGLGIYDTPLLTADLKAFSFDPDNNHEFLFQFTVASGSLAPFFQGNTWMKMHDLGDPADAEGADPSNITGTGFPGSFQVNWSSLTNTMPVADFGLLLTPEPSTVLLIPVGLGLLCLRMAIRRRNRNR